MASWKQARVLLATPMVASAAFALVACSPGENPSTEPGTTPPVFTSSPAPESAVGSDSESSEGGASEGSGDSLTGELTTATGQNVGTVTFTDESGHLRVEVEGTGMPAGFHGFHIHQNGVCEPNSVAPSGGEPGAFLSSGGHLQVDGRTEHPASGDLTSLQVREDGTAELVTTTDAVTMEDLENGGSGVSVIVHEGADNFANIPPRYTLPDGAPVPDQTTLTTGDAGGRLACAVVGNE